MQFGLLKIEDILGLIVIISCSIVFGTFASIIS